MIHTRTEPLLLAQGRKRRAFAAEADGAAVGGCGRAIDEVVPTADEDVCLADEDGLGGVM